MPHSQAFEQLPATDCGCDGPVCYVAYTTAYSPPYGEPKVDPQKIGCRVLTRPAAGEGGR